MLLAARYGSDVIVDLLKGFGIQYAALNPGATYRGLHDSIVNYGGNCPEIVTCTHEEIAVAIAHGYTKVTGKPMAAIVHRSEERRVGKECRSRGSRHHEKKKR